MLVEVLLGFVGSGLGAEGNGKGFMQGMGCSVGVAGSRGCPGSGAYVTLE